MADKRVTQIATVYDKDDLTLATDYLIGDRSGGSSFRILAEELVRGALGKITSVLNIGDDVDFDGQVTIDNAASVPMQINVSGTRRIGFLQNELSETYSSVYVIVAPSIDNGSLGGPAIVLGRNENGSTPAAGFLRVRNKDNTSYRLWVDGAGQWRINTADPTNANDTAGTVVGTQASLAAEKYIYDDLSPISEAMSRVAAGAEAVRRFSYKSGAYNSQKFEGVVIDFAPDYGMDRDAASPLGKSLNDIQILGDLLRTVNDLRRRVDELEARK